MTPPNTPQPYALPPEVVAVLESTRNFLLMTENGPLPTTRKEVLRQVEETLAKHVYRGEAP